MKLWQVMPILMSSLLATGLAGAAAGNPGDLREIEFNVDKGAALRPNAVPFVTITGDNPSPLERIHIGNENSFQIRHRTVPGMGQIYPSGLDSPSDMGVFIRAPSGSGGTLYAPDFLNHGGSATGSIGVHTPWAPVSTSALSGDGSAGTPYSYTVTSDAVGAGLRLVMTVTYVNTENFFRHNLNFTNTGPAEICFDTFIGSDLFLAGSDSGIPYLAGTHTPGGQDCPSQTYTILHIPLGPNADFHTARFYNSVWGEIGSGAPLTDTVAVGCQDNGAAIEWQNRCLQPGASLTFLAATSFGPIPSIVIPTLSEWAIIALFIGLIFAMTFVIWRRRMATQ